MNYRANTTQWRMGDIVLHDCDAKAPDMLMKVIGFTKKGLVKTQYVDLRRTREIYKNELGCLHDPQRFKINPEWGTHRQELIVKYCQQWHSVRIWNYRYPVNTPVFVDSADGGFTTTTDSLAYMRFGSGDACVWLKGEGVWMLDFVKPVKEAVF